MTSISDSVITILIIRTNTIYHVPVITKELRTWRTENVNNITLNVDAALELRTETNKIIIIHVMDLLFEDKVVGNSSFKQFVPVASLNFNKILR